MRVPLFLSIFISILLTACEKRGSDLLLFEGPQPLNGNDLKEFSSSIQGKYIKGEDSSFLIIDKNKIIEISSYKWMYSKNQFDSTDGVNIHDDKSIIDYFKKQGFQASIIGDSISTTFTANDTLFLLSDKSKLRKFKGNYFLNTEVYDGAWEVCRLELLKDKQLQLSYMYPEDSTEVDKMEKITAVSIINKDSESYEQKYKINPSKKEFKRLVKEEDFISGARIYKKIE
jgi:hypothetical protein